MGKLPDILNKTSYTVNLNVTMETSSKCVSMGSNMCLPFIIPQFKSSEVAIPTAIFLSMIIIATIVGNSFVIAAIKLEKQLRNTANMLIVSLAVTDLLVSVLVMPISIVNEISESWILGSFACDLWITLDVLCCTSSILHLVSIALDRYWAVTSTRYMQHRSLRRIVFMIVMCWVSGLVISIPPFLGWKDPLNDPKITGRCLISQDIGYTIFSTFAAFYIPAVGMMIIYGKIYKVAKSKIKKENKHRRQGSRDTLDELETSWRKARPKTYSEPPSSPNRMDYLKVNIFDALDLNGTTRISSVNNNNKQKPRSNSISMLTRPATLCIFDPYAPSQRSSIDDILRAARRKVKIETNRERRATRTLSIITGAFITCWLPFFILALVGPFLGARTFHPVLYSVVLWLGYCNSMLNPVLYTVFSPDFKNAFRRILIGRYWRKIYRH